jgi:hypothetical protein
MTVGKGISPSVFPGIPNGNPTLNKYVPHSLTICDRGEALRYRHAPRMELAKPRKIVIK